MSETYGSFVGFIRLKNRKRSHYFAHCRGEVVVYSFSSSSTVTMHNYVKQAGTAARLKPALTAAHTHTHAHTQTYISIQKVNT